MSEPNSGGRAAVFYPLYACNARCPFCSTRVYTDAGIIARPDLGRANPLPVDEQRYSLDAAKASLRRFRDEGTTRLNIQGGEPTLLDSLPDIVAYAREIGFGEVQIITNGIRLRDPAYARRLAASGPTGIALSVFGARAETHDDSLGVPGALSATERAIENLVGIQPRVHVTASFVLHAFNYTELVDMLEHFHALGLRYFTVRLLRETENTRRGRRQWFFDLHRASPVLQAAVDRAMELEDCTLTTSGIPYCLLGPRYLDFIASDLPASAHLGRVTTIEGHSRRSDAIPSDQRHVRGGAVRRLLRLFQSSPDRAPSAVKECRRCDLREVCLRVEDEYARHLGAPLEPMRLGKAPHG